MTTYVLTNGGYGWIDHVTIKGVAGVTIINKGNQGYVDFFNKDGWTIATAYTQFCDEIGVCSFDDFGEIESRKILYQY